MFARRWGRGKTPVTHIKKYSDDVLATTIITIALLVFVQTHKYKSTFKYGRYSAQEESAKKVQTYYRTVACSLDYDEHSRDNDTYLDILLFRMETVK